MLLYDQCNDWQKIAAYFDSLSPDVFEFIPDQSVIDLWQRNIQRYISTKPTPQTVGQLLNTRMPVWYGFFLRMPIHINAEYVSSVLLNTISEFSQSDTITHAIYDFYHQFPDLATRQTGNHTMSKPAKINQ